MDRLDAKRIDQLHNASKDLGLWWRQGRTSPGVYCISHWPETRHQSEPQPRRATIIKKSHPTLIQPHQPHSTRTVSPKNPVIPRDFYTLRRFEQAWRVILTIPDMDKLVYFCLYCKGQGFPDTGKALNIDGKQVGKHRFNAFTALNNVL